MCYRGHSVMQTLIRAYFSPADTTGQRFVYAGSADGVVHIWGALEPKHMSTDDNAGPEGHLASHTLPTLFTCRAHSTVASKLSEGAAMCPALHQSSCSTAAVLQTWLRVRWWTSWCTTERLCVTAAGILTSRRCAVARL